MTGPGIRLVTSPAEFEALRAPWERLFRDGDGRHIFQTFDWNFIWWKHLGHGYRLHILVAEDRGEVVGIWPLMYSEKHFAGRPWRRLEFIGKRYSNYHDLLLPADGTDTEILRALLASLLARMGERDYALLRRMPCDSSVTQTLRSLLGDDGATHHWAPDETSYLVLLRGDWPSYLREQVPSRFRLDTERQIRRLNETGALTFSACDDAATVEEALAELFRMKIAQRREAGEASFLEEPAFQAFEREIGATFLARACLFAHVLRVDGRIVAVNFDLALAGRVYCHLIAHDAEFDRRFSPGRLLQYYELGKCFEKGMREFDFAWDRAFYKTRWCNAERQTARLYLFKRPAKLQKLYLKRIRPALKRAYVGLLSPGGRSRLKRLLRLDP